MSDTVEPGQVEDAAQAIVKRMLAVFTCPFCHGNGKLDLGEEDGKKIRRPCSSCAGTGLLHPQSVKAIKQRFSGGDNGK